MPAAGEKYVRSKYLRGKYPQFTYKNFDYRFENGQLKILFNFSLEGNSSCGKPIMFKPYLIIKGLEKSLFQKIEIYALKNLIFHLGLIEMLSYWKASCSPKIKITAGNLNKPQLKWWKDIIFKGMGEYFYKNKINFKKDNFLTIETEGFDCYTGNTKKNKERNKTFYSESFSASQKNYRDC